MSNLRFDPRIKVKPSFRQTLSLGQFLLSRFCRKEKLEIPDIIDAAVCTTYYEDQQVAKEIVLELLHSLLSEKMLDPREYNRTRGLIKVLETNNFIKDYVKDEKVLNNLFNFDFQKMQSPQELVDLVFETKKEEMTIKDLKYFNNSGKLEDFLPEIKDKQQQIMAKALLERDDWEQDLKNLYQENKGKFAETLQSLHELGVQDQKLDDLLKEAINQTQDFKEYEELIQESGRFQTPSQELLNKMDKQQLLSAFEFARSLEKEFESNLMEDLFNTLLNKEIELDLPELMQAYNKSKEWTQKMNQAIQNQIQNASKEQKRDMRKKMLDQLKRNESNVNDQMFQKLLKAEEEKLANSLLDDADSSSSFLQMLADMTEADIPFDKDRALQQSKDMGINPNDMQNVLNPQYEQFSNMIQKKLDNFEKYAQFLNELDFSNAVEGDLLDSAMKNQIPSLLGAMAHKNLKHTLDMMESKGYKKPTDLDLLFQGMAKGSGMNLLVQWYHQVQTLPPEFRQRVQEFMRLVLIEEAEVYARSHFSIHRKGHMNESNNLRIYIEGDFLDAVDIEATTENLVDQGKKVDDLTNNDILCRDEKEGQFKVLLILDMSGSMSGEKLANCALTCMVLMHVLHAHELGIIAFESNTHILKSFQDQIDLELISGELLQLKAQGGTQISQSLKYIDDTLQNMEQNQLLFTCILSDFAVYETESEMKPYLDKMKNGNLRLHLITTEHPDKKIINFITQLIDLKTLMIRNPNQIPRAISEIVSEIR